MEILYVVCFQLIVYFLTAVCLHFVILFLTFTGTIKWIKVPNYPQWPGLIDNDPGALSLFTLIRNYLFFAQTQTLGMT